MGKMYSALVKKIVIYSNTVQSRFSDIEFSDNL